MNPNQPPAARIAAQFGAGLIFVCLVCSACSAGTSASSGPPATPQPAPATPTIATPTIATGPTKVNGPFLGGTEIAFQTAFGAPIGGNSGQFRQYQPTIDGTHVKVIVALGAGGVTDRARFVQVGPGDPGVTWNAATGVPMIKRFMPPDSTYQRDKQAPDAGTEHVYLSQLLGASFPPSVFVDLDTDAALTPGTFDYYCGGDVNADGGCVLLLGA
jgi:hypothetical protein